MAKIKFDPSATPLNKEHYGFTFQRNAYGHSMFPAGKNDRKRYTLQWEKMQYMSKAIRNWRNMSPETKNAWNVFASTFPQPTEKDPNTFLTGYQLFLKRNFYRFLHEGINFDFLLEPELSQLPDPDFTISIIEDGLCVDVTEQYIRNHGILPEAGQFIICRVIPIAVNSGQFFAPFIATLEVQEVYIDGLVCSFNFPNVVENIVFSLYMSKPVWESVQYPGTKFRYMGCFKPTKFIQLTDTPDSYEGEAGKIVKVKDDETGLEFGEGSGCEVCPPVPGPGDAGKVIQVNPAGDGYELAEGGGGGFDCDDLLNCSIIQQILDSISNIGDVVSKEHDTSIPPINYGLLYNVFVVEDSRNIAPVGFKVPDFSEAYSLGTALGGYLVAGGPLKEIGFIHWNSPNTGADNSSGFNGKGTGTRAGNNGTYSLLKDTSFFWSTNDPPGVNKYGWRLRASTSDYRYYAQSANDGHSIRCFKPAPGISDGVIGSVVGNSGIVYRTIVIDEKEWIADPLRDVHFQNGDEIPEVTNNAAWAALTTPALCAYNNDWSNV